MYGLKLIDCCESRPHKKGVWYLCGCPLPLHANKKYNNDDDGDDDDDVNDSDDDDDDDDDDGDDNDDILYRLSII